MNHDARTKRLRFRAWHRGTKEADLMIGGFFDARSGGWDEEQIAWFEALRNGGDVAIVGCAIGTQAPALGFQGERMEAL